MWLTFTSSLPPACLLPAGWRRHGAGAAARGETERYFDLSWPAAFQPFTVARLLLWLVRGIEKHSLGDLLEGVCPSDKKKQIALFDFLLNSRLTVLCLGK